jgi:hypothetical protein
MSEEKLLRYGALMHAMQTGIEYGVDETLPRDVPPSLFRALKHLRVGINSCLINQAALSELLVAKGVFTDDEYLNKMLEKLEQEVRSYEQLLTQQKGVKVKLG